MCGRYRNTQSWSDLHGALTRFLGSPSQPALNLEPREQIRPTQGAPIVTLEDGKPRVWHARWWLIPFFHNGAVRDWKATTFNARAETVATSRAYRHSFAEKRCLVPADGWYEWKGLRNDGSDRKQPWLFERRDGEPIMFAGIWAKCETTDLGTIESFSIITQPSGAPLNGYHDRAPVVLEGHQWSKWLDLKSDVSSLLVAESGDLYSVTKSEIR